MVWVILIFGAGLIAIMRNEAQRLIQKPAKDVTPAPVAIPSIGSLDFSNPESLREAAETAQKAGYIESAKALASKAQEIGDIAKAIQGDKTPLPSPIPGIPDIRWSAFAQLFRGGDVREISPAFHLGLYNVGFLRLRDLGLASDLRREKFNGVEVWMGKLKPPMTVEKFLADPTLQYRVFAKDMTDRAAFLEKNYSTLVGRVIEGIPATLSGLLAVIKLSGTKGFDGWVNDPAQRRKFINTTAAYKRANHIF